MHVYKNTVKSKKKLLKRMARVKQLISIMYVANYPSSNEITDPYKIIIDLFQERGLMTRL